MTNTTHFLKLNSSIEHTLLKPEVTEFDIRRLCSEAIQYQFKGVCVNSQYIEEAKKQLNQTEVLIVSVVGFPLGACHRDVKKKEAELSVSLGAQELDMVINVGAIKSNNWSLAQKDIESVTKSVSVPVKVILETGLLTPEEIQNACRISEAAGAQFVKTSTGFSQGGATVEVIELMKRSISPKMQIKASGGIKTAHQAFALLEAGASRLGTSSGVQIILGQATDPQTY